MPLKPRKQTKPIITDRSLYETPILELFDIVYFFKLINILWWGQGLFLSVFVWRDFCDNFTILQPF